MAKTFVVKLAETVDNDSLPKLTEMKFNIVPVSSLTPSGLTPTNWSQGIDLTSSGPLPMTLTGEGHFTDTTLTQDLGKTYTKPAGRSTVYVSDGTSVLSVLNKHLITSMVFYGGSTTTQFHHNWSFNLSDVAGMPNITNLYLHWPNMKGSLSSLKKLTKLQVLFIAPYNGTVNNVGGSLADIEGLTQLTQLNLFGVKVTGNISSLLGLTNLTKAELSYCTGITGNTSSIAALHPNNGGKLATLSIAHTGVTGTWPPSE